METTYFLGVDIGKHSLQAALTIDSVNFLEKEFENTAKGIAQYFDELRHMFSLNQRKQLVVCIEHTGVYMAPLVNYLIKADIRLCIESAMQIKRSQGIQRGKNDRIDARRIVLYLFKNHQTLRYWKPEREIIQKIDALLVTRDRLVSSKVMLEVPIKELKSFKDGNIPKGIATSCAASIAAIKKDIKKIEHQLKELIKSDVALANQMRIVTSVCGIGLIVGLNLIVSTGEFKRITNGKKFACYSGVAPFEHSSGTSVKGRTKVSKMANMRIKKLLQMSARSAILCSAELGSFYQRKVGEGKNKMSVLNAVRNKLITRVFACIKNNRLYEKDYQNVLA